MKSKVEARKSVENQCDYSRMNGKCGRALCENFGKPCPGRTCEDWKCDAENVEEVEVVEDVKNVRTVAKRTSSTSSTLSTSSTSYKDRVSEQYVAIETAKDNLLRECVKFGALLTEVGYYLGEARGRGKDGEGLQAWLAENCPEVNYSTAMNYKALAGKCVKMLGGGSQAVAVLQDKTEIVPPGEEEAVEVESKFIEKRDELFNEVKSRRELEQTYFKFMAAEGRGKPGRKAGSREQGMGNGEQGRVKVRSLLEMALLYAEPICTALKKSVTHSTVKDLQGWDRSLLEEYVANVEQYLKELKEVLKAR